MMNFNQLKLHLVFSTERSLFFVFAEFSINPQVPDDCVDAFHKQFHCHCANAVWWQPPRRVQTARKLWSLGHTNIPNILFMKSNVMQIQRKSNMNNLVICLLKFTALPTTNEFEVNCFAHREDEKLYAIISTAPKTKKEIFPLKMYCSRTEKHAQFFQFKF